MSSRPVLEEEEVTYQPVREEELDEALEYAAKSRSEEYYKKGPKQGQSKRKAYIGQVLDRDLLRILGNTALKRRAEEPTTRLVQIAAYTAREAIPMFRAETVRETQLRYESYMCAVMKIMSIRRVWQMRRDAQRKLLGQPIPERVQQTEYPLDKRKKFKNQRRMFS